MKVFIKFDFNRICNKVLQEKLDASNLKYRVLGFGEVEFLNVVSEDQLKDFSHSLFPYGVEIVENQKTILIT